MMGIGVCWCVCVCEGGGGGGSQNAGWHPENRISQDWLETVLHYYICRC